MTSRIRELAAATPEMAAVFDDRATVAAALAFEAALARACAEEGLAPADAAAVIEAACGEPLDPETLAREAAHAGTLAIPLVAALRARSGEAAKYVHLGATSQDVADTVLMLQAKAARPLIESELDRLLAGLASRAEAHAASPMIGRTLLQQARPITFGLKTAGWLQLAEGAARRFRREADAAIRLQLGGAAGARHDLGGRGEAVAIRIGAALGLPAAPPWHANREGVAGLGAALAIVTGAAAKVARDVSLLAQNEVAEAFEPAAEGRGGSSTMSHKRNPTGCQVALSAGLRAPHLAAAILSGLPQEHERGLGGWQAEGALLAELFQLAHGALVSMREVVEGLEVDTAAMAAKLGDDHDIGESEALVRGVLAAWRRPGG